MSATDNELLKLEQQVENGLRKVDAGNLEAAEAIQKIHSRQLWPKDKSWGEYLLDRFDIGEVRAEQLMAWVELREALQGERLPNCERQARALLKTDEEHRQSVWDEACKRSGKKSPTGPQIEQIVTEMRAKKLADAGPPSSGNSSPPLATTRRSSKPPKQSVKPTNAKETKDRTGVQSGQVKGNGQSGGEIVSPEEPTIIKINMTLLGLADFADTEQFLREAFGAEKTNVRDEQGDCAKIGNLVWSRQDDSLL